MAEGKENVKEIIIWSGLTVAICLALIALGLPWIPMAFIMVLTVMLCAFQALRLKGEGGPEYDWYKDKPRI